MKSWMWQQSKKVAEAAILEAGNEYYKRFGELPQVCEMNIKYDAPDFVGTIRVQKVKNVPPGHYLMRGDDKK